MRLSLTYFILLLSHSLLITTGRNETFNETGRSNSSIDNVSNSVDQKFGKSEINSTEDYYDDDNYMDDVPLNSRRPWNKDFMSKSKKAESAEGLNPMAIMGIVSGVLFAIAVGVIVVIRKTKKLDPTFRSYNVSPQN